MPLLSVSGSGPLQGAWHGLYLAEPWEHGYLYLDFKEWSHPSEPQARDPRFGESWPQDPNQEATQPRQRGAVGVRPLQKATHAAVPLSHEGDIIKPEGYS